jgi:mono/diheme cytochrome c family protein
MSGLSLQLVLGLVLLAIAAVLDLLAYRARQGARTASSSVFGRARAFAALAFISGAVFAIGGVVNASGPPITYVNSTPDTVASVDRGAVTYDATCARCHGLEYRGDGSDAGTTQVAPASLLSGHLATHDDSDIYTWIRDGLPGGMPAFSTSLTEVQRWDLVNFLRGINGQGPSPDVAPSDSSAALAGFGLVGGVALLFVGWYSAGIRRTLTRPPRGPR